MSIRHRFAGRRLPGFTLVEMMVVLGVIALLIAIILPGVQMAREAARRTQCRNHLMLLIVATHTYEQSHGSLPSGVVNPAGPIRTEPVGYHFSWLAQLLPFVGHVGLHDQVDFTASVYEAANSTVRSTVVGLFVCPAEMSAGEMGPFGPASYAACHHDLESPIDSDDRGVFFLNSQIRSEAIEDGAANTIFVGEKVIERRHLGWMSGTASTVRNTGESINGHGVRPPRWVVAPDHSAPSDPLAVGGFSSVHPGGAHFAIGDGSVRFISESVTPTVLQQLANRSDGVAVGDSEF